MELNRHHYLTIGLICIFLGIQFRMVKTYTLTEQSTQFLAKRMKLTEPTTPAPVMAIWDMAGTPQTKRQFSPPNWLGFSLIAFGAVLVLQSLAMKKPGT
jgi:hypothetical protein